MRQQLNSLVGSAVLALFVAAPAIAADVGGGGAQAVAGERLILADISSANTFNRNLKKEKDPNAAPPEDGYHDPENAGTHILQPPKDAYVGLPTTEFGNHVDWVKSIDEKKLSPRWDRINSNEEPFVMDLDIVRPVKASVPDVVFPHRQHTEWLACANCHPAILLRQKCGVFHGKVSFPITTKTCSKCHSKAKPADWAPPLSDASLKNPWR